MRHAPRPRSSCEALAKPQRPTWSLASRVPHEAAELASSARDPYVPIVLAFSAGSGLYGLVKYETTSTSADNTTSMPYTFLLAGSIRLCVVGVWPSFHSLQSDIHFSTRLLVRRH